MLNIFVSINHRNINVEMIVGDQVIVVFSFSRVSETYFSFKVAHSSPTHGTISKIVMKCFPFLLVLTFRKFEDFSFFVEISRVKLYKNKSFKRTNR